MLVNRMGENLPLSNLERHLEGVLKIDSSSQKLSIHQVFAQNLRINCLQVGTIAEACRAIGINRQQFNKYLSGAALPNSQTLRRICSALHIREQDLFEAQSSKFESKQELLLGALSNPRAQPRLPNFISDNFDQQVTELESGWYYCYFEIPSEKDTFMRSLISINRKPHQTEFTRLTLLPSVQKRVSILKGKHKGIVCKNDSDIFFIGVNSYPPKQISFMIMPLKPRGPKRYHTGYAVTKSYDTSIITRFCLVKLDSNLSRKQTVLSLGKVTSANPEVQDLIAMQCLS